LWRAAVVNPQCGQISRRRRSRTSTTTRSGSKATSVTLTPSSCSSMSNAVVTRTVM